jgi:hypothetical protein
VSHLQLARISIAAFYDIKQFANSFSIYVCDSFVNVLPFKVILIGWLSNGNMLLLKQNV